MNRRSSVAALVAMLLAVAGDPIAAQSSANRLPNPGAIVGSWEVEVPQSEGGAPAFKAFHTFGLGGTFTETSSNFATLTEGPAHGVWNVDRGRVNLTFELFAFDNGLLVGVVRVRCAIRLLTTDTLQGTYVVDFIEPGGSVAEGIDTGSFRGSRMHVRAI